MFSNTKNTVKIFKIEDNKEYLLKCENRGNKKIIWSFNSAYIATYAYFHSREVTILRVANG